jgi:hypothetical protein
MLPVLTLKRLDPFALLRAWPVSLAGNPFSLRHPFMQRLRVQPTFPATETVAARRDGVLVAMFHHHPNHSLKYLSRAMRGLLPLCHCCSFSKKMAPGICGTAGSKLFLQ